jgi:hypothetical protein
VALVKSLAEGRGPTAMVTPQWLDHVPTPAWTAVADTVRHAARVFDTAEPELSWRLRDVSRELNTRTAALEHTTAARMARAGFAGMLLLPADHPATPPLEQQAECRDAGPHGSDDLGAEGPGRCAARSGGVVRPDSRGRWRAAADSRAGDRGRRHRRRRRRASALERSAAGQATPRRSDNGQRAQALLSLELRRSVLGDQAPNRDWIVRSVPGGDRAYGGATAAAANLASWAWSLRERATENDALGSLLTRVGIGEIADELNAVGHELAKRHGFTVPRTPTKPAQKPAEADDTLLTAGTAPSSTTDTKVPVAVATAVDAEPERGESSDSRAEVEPLTLSDGREVACVLDPEQELPAGYRGRLRADAYQRVEPGRFRLVVLCDPPELAGPRPWSWAVQQIDTEGNATGAGLRRQQSSTHSEIVHPAGRPP